MTVAGRRPSAVVEPDAPRGTWRISELPSSTAVFAGVAVLTVAPIIVAAASLVGRHWHPASDLPSSSSRSTTSAGVTPP